MSDRRKVIIPFSRYGPCSACGDGDTAMVYHTHGPRPKSYTLDDLEQLAREFITQQQHQSEYPTRLQLVLSLFIQWARKREKEAGDGRS